MTSKGPNNPGREVKYHGTTYNARPWNAPRKQERAAELWARRHVVGCDVLRSWRSHHASPQTKINRQHYHPVVSPRRAHFFREQSIRQKHSQFDVDDGLACSPVMRARIGGSTDNLVGVTFIQNSSRTPALLPRTRRSGLVCTG